MTFSQQFAMLLAGGVLTITGIVLKLLWNLLTSKLRDLDNKISGFDANVEKNVERVRASVDNLEHKMNERHRSHGHEFRSIREGMGGILTLVGENGQKTIDANQKTIGMILEKLIDQSPRDVSKTVKESVS